MAAIAEMIDIYSENGQLRRPLAWSLGLHLGFAAFVVLYTMFIHSVRGQGWGSGGGGDAMGATLVSAIPLPANEVQTANVLATESKGLSKSQPNGAGERAGCDSDSRQEHEDKSNAGKKRNATQAGAGGDLNQIRFRMAREVPSAGLIR